MQIGKISLHTAEAKKSINKQNELSQNKAMQNPFGVSFKGNVIQADVFESSAKKESTGLMAKGKVFAGAVISGMNNFNEAFSSRMNAVVSFGKKIVADVSKTIENIGSTDVSTCFEGMKNKIFPDRQYSVKNLSKKPVEELKSMWEDITPEIQA